MDESLRSMLRACHFMTEIYEDKVPADLSDFWSRLEKDKAGPRIYFEKVPCLAIVLAGIKYGPARDLLDRLIAKRRAWSWQAVYAVLAELATEMGGLGTNHAHKLWTHHYATRGSGPIAMLERIGLLRSPQKGRASGRELRLGAAKTAWLLLSEEDSQESMMRLYDTNRVVAGVLQRGATTCLDWQESVRHLSGCIAPRKSKDYNVLWLARALHDSKPLLLFTEDAASASCPLGAYGQKLLEGQILATFAETVPDECDWLSRAAEFLQAVFSWSLLLDVVVLVSGWLGCIIRLRFVQVSTLPQLMDALLSASARQLVRPQHMSCWMCFGGMMPNSVNFRQCEMQERRQERLQFEIEFGWTPNPMRLLEQRLFPAASSWKRHLAAQ